MPVDRPQEGWIHTWFELTYASHLVLNRTLLQSMPDQWQERFVGLLRELEGAFPRGLTPPGYWLRPRGEGNKFIEDPCPHYNRGRTYIEPNLVAMEGARRAHEEAVVRLRDDLED